MGRRLTRRQRIDILQDRHDYLIKKRDERADDGRPIGFITDEIKVLAWAIDTLTELVDSDLENLPKRGDVAEEYAYTMIDAVPDPEPAEPAEKSTKEVL